MPKKYSTLDQIVNALLKKEKLDDSKHQELQNAIKTITASNVDDVVRDHLSRCLEIKQDISNLSISVNKANTSDAIKELRGKISSIEDKIKEIDIDKIKLGIETKKVKTQISSIKENFQPNIEKFKKELRQKENEINENNLKEAAQKKVSQQKESSSVELRQSPTKETGAIPKQRNSNNQRRNKQFPIITKKEKEQKAKQEAERLQKEKKVEEKKKSKTQVKKIEEFHLLYYQFDSIIRKVKSTMYHNILNILNTKGIMFKNENMHNKECSEQFSLTINCYVKVYCIGRLVLGGIKVEKNSVSDREVLQNEFKELKREKRLSFERLLSLFTQKSCGARVKPRIVDIEKNFNAIMNILSEYTSFPADLCYPNMPDVKNTDKILDDLSKKMLNRIGVDKMTRENEKYCQTLSDSNVSEIFDGTFDNVFQSYIDKAMEQLTKRYLPSNSIKETSIEPQGACAQAEK